MLCVKHRYTVQKGRHMFQKYLHYEWELFSVFRICTYKSCGVQDRCASGRLTPRKNPNRKNGCYSLKKIIGENWCVRFSNAACRSWVFSLPLSWPYVYISVPKLHTDDYDDKSIVYGRIVHGIFFTMQQFWMLCRRSWQLFPWVLYTVQDIQSFPEE